MGCQTIEGGVMSRRKWMAVALVALAVIVAGALVLGACGSSSSSSSSASSSASAAAGGAYNVGFVNSATGVSAAPNQAIVGSTQGAVGQTNAQGGIDGKWQINLISKDDGSDVAKASAIGAALCILAAILARPVKVGG